MDEDFFPVIIDSMCNLVLLYCAGYYTGNQQLIDIATRHAHTVFRAIVCDDWSIYHLISFDAKTGGVKIRLTNQGHKDGHREAETRRGQSSTTSPRPAKAGSIENRPSR
ncbi:Six-hairpin glycosidase-like protein [Cadophora sp. MPI-SDFR-AT-0126]|nr:Six-hairpin glycosidase-like protein [Leotiomycetes sp. MPI-SDFR-AT-0126]